MSQHVCEHNDIGEMHLNRTNLLTRADGVSKFAHISLSETYSNLNGDTLSDQKSLPPFNLLTLLDLVKI